MGKQRILFIVNRKSGTQHYDISPLVSRHLDLSKFQFAVENTRGPAHATELCRSGIEDKFEIIAAVGGDGTVNEVSKEIISTDVKLAIIPMGSGNGFARHLDIPLKPAKALANINRLKSKIIDTATLNGIPFVNMAGLGFDAQVAHKFSKDGQRGFFTYVKVALNEYINFKPHHYSILIDDLNIETRALSVTIANGAQFGNNAYIAPHAQLNDGFLDLCILKRITPSQIPRLTYQLFTKKLERSNSYQSIRGREIKIHHKDPILHIDGEPRKAIQEIHIKIVPDSLNVIC